MTVYVLMIGEYDGSKVIGVFSSQGAASAAEKQVNPDMDTYVEEHEVDSVTGVDQAVARQLEEAAKNREYRARMAAEAASREMTE